MIITIKNETDYEKELILSVLKAIEENSPLGKLEIKEVQ